MSNKRTRDRIVEEADQLFYQQGFEHTSFAQIAEALGISRGNFYYHFKTKDEILDAVINHRLTRTHAMLEHWEIEGDTPLDRIRSFINILVMNQAKIKQHGCPVGTLSMELTKLSHSSREHANELFTLFRIWLSRQFEQLGHHKHADELAMHLLSLSQGVATLYSAFQDDEFINNEVARIQDWLTAIATQTQTQQEKL